MTFKEVQTTWVCQLNKPETRAMLERYRDNKDRSLHNLINYYRDIISALKDTPAWGVSGVNKIVNKLTDHVRATAEKAKAGKTSAYAHAGKLLNDIDHWKDLECESSEFVRTHWLKPIITEEELQQLELLALEN